MHTLKKECSVTFQPSPNRRHVKIRTTQILKRLPVLILAYSFSLILASAAPGSWDLSFRALVYDSVDAIAIQPDGKILVGGYFTPKHITRLNTDGTTDTNFNPGTGLSWPPTYTAGLGPVTSIALQPDGRILVAGAFTNFDGVYCTGLVRLFPNGTLDTNFVPILDVYGQTAYPSTVLSQPDGKVLVGGGFNAVCGIRRDLIARLNTNGTVDTNFAYVPLYNGEVSCIALQTNGQILVGGEFMVGGLGYTAVARLNADGTVDPTFAYVNTSVYSGADALAIQRDGKVLIGGAFDQVNGTNRWLVARLNTDGTLDLSFAAVPLTGQNLVRSIALQGDGKVLIAGVFSLWNSGGLINNIGRICVDGSVDHGFDPGVGIGARLRCVVLQRDGKVLIGGTVSDANGNLRNNLTRLFGDDPPSLDAITILNHGIVQLTGTATTNTLLRVDASTDLLTWEPLSQLLNTNGLFFLLDTNASNFPRRFYRASLPSP
jgi:uncharacterized delta-60 repeat protein